MAEKTIKITSLPVATTEDNIRNALPSIKISKVSINKTEAYVELQDIEDLDILEFSAPEGKLDLLEGATFSKVEDNFQWPNNSPVQQLNYDQHQKTEQTPINLTDPNKDHLITISQCDSEVLNKLSEEQIKSTVFTDFNSINRVLKKPNSVIIQLQDTSQKQKLEGIFKELKVPALGNSAHINLEAEDVPHFSSEWISQHHKESRDIKDEDGNPKHCLHEAIIPKLNKLTSMETDFLNSQSSANVGKIEQHHQIAEQSEEQIQTQNELSDKHQNFILNQSPIEQLKTNNNTHEEEQRQRQLLIKKEQERLAKQEQQRLQKQKYQQQQNERQTRQQEIRAQQKQKEIQAEAKKQQLKIQTEQQEKKALETKHKIQQQAIRISKQVQQASQQQLQKVKGFVLNENNFAEASTQISDKIERAKYNLGDFIMGTDAERLETLLGSEAKTPTVFWAIIVVSVLALLMI